MRSSIPLAATAAAGVLALCGGCGSGGGGVGTNAQLVTISTQGMPEGMAGVDYEAVVQAHFPHPPGVFYVSEGILPQGLRLEAASATSVRVTGIPVAAGESTFELTARDGTDPAKPLGVTDVTAARVYTLRVREGPPVFLPQTLPQAAYNRSYSYFLEVAGGTPPIQFAMTDGSLPPGLVFKSSGQILGNPTLAGVASYSFQATVADALGRSDTQWFDLENVLPPLVIGTAKLPKAAKDFAFSLQLTLSSNGTGAAIEWSQQTAGPGETVLGDVGMELTPAGLLRNKATVPGPTTLGTFAFTVRVTDSVAQVTTRVFDLVVSTAPVIDSITPNRSAVPGPYIVKGAGFEPGATLTFGPELSSAITVTPDFYNSSTLSQGSVPLPPPATGPVTVRVKNPGGGYADLLRGYYYPAAALEFSTTPVLPLPNSPLSSTGVDVADVNGDGFADVVHCGTTSDGWSSAAGAVGGIDLLVNAPTGNPPRFVTTLPPFTRIALTTSGDWHQVHFSDVNTDGHPDVVAVGVVGGVGEIRAYLNPYPAPFTAGMGFQSTALEYTGGANGHVSDMAVGRMDGDGIPDLIYVNQDPAALNATGTGFGIIAGVTSPPIGLYGSFVYYVEAGGSVTAVRGLGTGTFASPVLKTDTAIQGLFSAAGVALGQLDDKVGEDVVVTDQSVFHVNWAKMTRSAPGDMAYFAKSSGGVFGTWSPLHHAGGGADYVEVLGVAVADATGDGVGDVTMAAGYDPDFGAWGGTPLLAQFKGKGDGTFSELPAQPNNIGLRYVVAFDGDFDAAMDVAATASGGPGNSDHVFLYQGGTDGSTMVQHFFAGFGGANLGRIASGDFDRDGKADLCACMSFFADAREDGSNPGANAANPTRHVGPSGVAHKDRGMGATPGVVIMLNRSQ